MPSTRKGHCSPYHAADLRKNSPWFRDGISKHRDQEEEKSCYDLPALLKMARAHNKKNLTKKIDLTISKEELWNQIDAALASQCLGRHESCFLRHLGEEIETSAKEAERTYFRPEMPESWSKNNPHVWLTNQDILYVAKQYMHLFRNFLFYGPVPRDFAHPVSMANSVSSTIRKGDLCLVPELCHINIEALSKKKKTKIGVIYNTDFHEQPGEHWVASFFDLDRKYPKIFYFDSIAHDPPIEIYEFLTATARKMSFTLKKTVEVQINRHRLQFSNSECGVYCLHFLVCMLHHDDVHTFENYISRFGLNDAHMHKFRSTFFRPREK